MPVANKSTWPNAEHGFRIVEQVLMAACLLCESGHLGQLAERQWQLNKHCWCRCTWCNLLHEPLAFHYDRCCVLLAVVQELLEHPFLHPNRRVPASAAAAPAVGLSEEQMKALVAQVGSRSKLRRAVR
jgi:hypothetical protein